MCDVTKNHTGLGDRSFTTAGPRIWNNLSLHLRDSELTLTVAHRSRVRPPVYALPRNNLGQVVYMHVPLSTKQYKLVPALAGT